MIHYRTVTVVLLATVATTFCLAADASKSQKPIKAKVPDISKTGEVRLIPPPGNDIPAADRAELEAGVDALDKSIALLRKALADKPEMLGLLPDVEIYHRAVRSVLTYHEPLEVKDARRVLIDGMTRARQLESGSPQWLTADGPRGYVSKIDGSVQPYQLLVPSSVKNKPTDSDRRYRLDIFCHGRQETLTELSFIAKPAGNGPTPGDKFCLLPYGRYCNANKFAGEIDVLEAMDDVKRRNRIDENRIVEMGFSMGGASAWQFAVHYADLWAAASPGAGFSETKQFLKMAESGEFATVPDYQKTLWHLYDCTDYAANLFNLPLIAYAGEIDPQKQASDAMIQPMTEEGLTLRRLIGPKTQHKYEPESRKELDRQLDEIVVKGRNPVPTKVRLTTWTLRYNRMYWITLDGLEKHWERARAEGELTAGGGLKLSTQNVSAITIRFPAGLCPLTRGTMPTVELDGGKFAGPIAGDGVWTARFVKSDGGWKPGTIDDALRKRPGLQGPIDDAFMDSFMIVKPTGKPLNDKVASWTKSEAEHAIDHWRKQFRGEARVKTDAEVSDADIGGSNLILFGDPSSNRILAKMAGKLPIRWTESSVAVGDRQFPAGQHVPVLIYPNPLNPSRYIVLNSGFTFREFDYLNNARQVPKLPDWAVMDISVPATAYAPAKVADAGFFGERWELPTK